MYVFYYSTVIYIIFGKRYQSACVIKLNLYFKIAVEICDIIIFCIGENNILKCRVI